jgi:hypothetical protein
VDSQELIASESGAEKTSFEVDATSLKKQCIIEGFAETTSAADCEKRPADEVEESEKSLTILKKS